MRRSPNGSLGRLKRGFLPPGSANEGGGVRYGAISAAELARGRITVGRAIEAHVAYLESRNYSPHTIRSVGHAIGAFLRLARLSGQTPLVEVTPEIAERAMAKLRSRYGPGTAWRYATSWVQLFRAFTAAGLLLESPFARVEWPRRPRLLPLAALTKDEMEKLLRAPNLKLPSGVRNRAMLEVFYSTGIRLSECAGLSVRDVDFALGTVTVHRGKGGKARVVPVGEEAMNRLRRYLKDVRLRWAGKAEALWIGQTGQSLSTLWIERIVSRLGRKAGIEKAVTPHALRRTCATHLLSAGASAWAVKGILGHADFKSLGRYVTLGAKELKDEHGKTHPRS